MLHWERKNREINNEKTQKGSHRQSEGREWRVHGVGKGLGRVSYGVGRHYRQDVEFEEAKQERRRVFLVEGAPQPKSGVRMKSHTLGLLRNLLTRREKQREVAPGSLPCQHQHLS